jgi:hypothetical protein
LFNGQGATEAAKPTNQSQEEDDILSNLGSDDNLSFPTLPKNIKLAKIPSSEALNDVKITPNKTRKLGKESIMEFDNPFASFTSTEGKLNPEDLLDTANKELKNGLEENDDSEDLQQLAKTIEKTVTPLQSPPKPTRSVTKGGY